jgi:hypothetical protein
MRISAPIRGWRSYPGVMQTRLWPMCLRLLMSLLLLVSLPLWAAQPVHCGGHGGHGAQPGQGQGSRAGHTAHSVVSVSGMAHSVHSAHLAHSAHAAHAAHNADVALQPDHAGGVSDHAIAVFASAAVGTADTVHHGGSVGTDTPCADCDLGCMAACATVGLPVGGNALPAPLLSAAPLPLSSFDPLRAHRVPLLRPPSPSKHC